MLRYYSSLFFLCGPFHSQISFPFAGAKNKSKPGGSRDTSNPDPAFARYLDFQRQLHNPPAAQPLMYQPQAAVPTAYYPPAAVYTPPPASAPPPAYVPNMPIPIPIPAGGRRPQIGISTIKPLESYPASHFTRPCAYCKHTAHIGDNCWVTYPMLRMANATTK